MTNIQIAGMSIKQTVNYTVLYVITGVIGAICLVIFVITYYIESIKAMRFDGYIDLNEQIPFLFIGAICSLLSFIFWIISLLRLFKAGEMLAAVQTSDVHEASVVDSDEPTTDIQAKDFETTGLQVFEVEGSSESVVEFDKLKSLLDAKAISLEEFDALIEKLK